MTNQPAQERKKNQRWGFFACLGINAILLVIWYLYPIASSPPETANAEILRLALPWAVNIGVLVLALVWRPQFAVGYLAFFAVVIIGAMVVGVVFVTACFASIVTMLVLSPLGDAAGYLGLYCVLPLGFFGGLYFLGKTFLPQIREWWRGDQVDDHPA